MGRNGWSRPPKGRQTGGVDCSGGIMAPPGDSEGGEGVCRGGARERTGLTGV